MHLSLDVKLAKIQAEKQRAKQAIMMQQAQGMREKYTGMILQKRLLNEDDVDIHTSAREFISIEKLDQTITSIGSAKAFFTIGVVVDVSGPLQAKSGKNFSIVKLTDLVKYDLAKVRKMLET